MSTRGHHLTPERQATLVSTLNDWRGYDDPRLEGFSSSTVKRWLDKLGIEIPGARRKASAKAASEASVKPEPYRPGGSAADRRVVELEGEVSRLRAELRRAHRDALDEEAIRTILGHIASAPEAPPAWVLEAPQPPRQGERTPEVPVVIWSDWHFGEVVEPASVAGYNAFSPEIGEERVRRLVESIIRLARRHGPGNYPGIVVAILGDMISGGLHPELAKTDEEERIPSALRCRDILIWAIETLADEFGRVYVPCASGNHGRETPKPEFKRYVQKNFDWMIYQLLARHFAGRGDVRIEIPITNEVPFRVWSTRFLGMHGDMMGVKGGDGIIGAIGPIMRGEIKVRGQVSTLGRDYDIALMGHWHQELWLPRAFVNGTLKGWDEYARLALRAPPAAPAQSLFFVHPRRGVTSRWSVQVETGAVEQASGWVSWPASAA